MNKVFFEFMCEMINSSTISVINDKNGTIYMLHPDADLFLNDLKMHVTYSEPMTVNYVLYDDEKILCVATKKLFEESRKNSTPYFMEELAKQFSRKLIKQELNAQKNNMLKFFGDRQRS